MIPSGMYIRGKTTSVYTNTPVSVSSSLWCGLYDYSGSVRVYVNISNITLTRYSKSFPVHHIRKEV